MSKISTICKNLLIRDNFIFTLFRVAYLCGELFVDHLHADEHALVAVECFEGGAVAVGIVVEVFAAEIVVGELAEIVVAVLVETVVAEIAVVQQIAVDYPAEIVAAVLEAGLAEIAVALVGTAPGLRLGELVADHRLSVNIEKD